MARRNLSLGHIGTLAALIFIIGAALTGLLPLLRLGWAEAQTGLSPYLWQVLRFTLWQAALSTLLSVGIGLAAARALARRQFPGRDFLLRLMVLPQALPAIVVVLSLLALFGNAGLLAGAIPVYGLSGILMAHVFFNMPLATRMILSRYEAIPAESYRLAAQLQFSAFDTLRHVEWPIIAPALKAAAGLIFLLCSASFAVVLVLGGGPQATTLEVAIYQSLRMDFNPGFAALLSIAQLLLCGAAMLAVGRSAARPDVIPAISKRANAPDGGLPALVFDCFALLLAALILVPPLLAMLASGMGHVVFSMALLSAMVTSFAVGIFAMLLSLLFGSLLASAAARSSSQVMRATITITSLAFLLMPPAVIATGWFVTLAPYGDVAQLAPLLVVLLNALVALPFVRAIIEPAMAQSFARHDRLSESLGITGWARLRLIELPVLRKPLALAAIMAFVMSLGDLAAITLFGNADFVTLPALIYRQMGHYQMAEAGGTALLLAALCFLLTFIITPLARTDDHA